MIPRPSNPRATLPDPRWTDTDMSAAVAAALAELLPDRSPDIVEDLCAAGREVLRRRRANTETGGVVFAALRAAGLSWRSIQARTGVPVRTARRWAEPTP